ncbi:hypothetical protein KCU65_g7206, partial [Aureobasidium melanogenum]
MKWFTLLLVTISFGLLAAAKPDPDCGDPHRPWPVEELTCGDSLSDLGCKWHSDKVACIQRCRHQKGLNRYIYHNGRYYDITVEEYDRLMAAEDCKSKTAVKTKTKTTKKHGATKTTKKAIASSTSKETGFKTVTRTITHVARWPTELEAAGTKTFTKVWSDGTPIVVFPTGTSTGAEPEEEHHHPRLDHFCQKTSQVAKCRVKCGIHILGGFQKCMKKCHAKCHKNHPVHPDGEALVKRDDDSTQTLSTSFRIATPTVTKTVQPSATEVAVQTFATVTHVARWPTASAEVSATRTFTKVWSNGTPIVASPTAGAELEAEEEEHHHPRIDNYCSSELQMYKCRQKCAHHDFIFGIGKKKCEHKCHEKCHRKHPLFPDGEDQGLVKRADNDTVLNQAIDDVIDTAIDTLRNQTSVIANAANLNLTERSEGHKKPYCASDNVIMGCKALAQLWAPAYDTIFKKCIDRCIRRHGPDSWVITKGGV